MKHLDWLPQLLPNEVLFDFLTRCGLTAIRRRSREQHACDAANRRLDRARSAFRRDCILTAFPQIALLADSADQGALRLVATEAPIRSQRGAFPRRKHVWAVCLTNAWTIFLS